MKTIRMGCPKQRGKSTPGGKAPPARRGRRRIWITLILAVVVVGAIGLWALSRKESTPLAIPAAKYEEQADGANRVIVDPTAMAAFCGSLGLPEPPVLAEIDGVLAQRLYEAHAEIAVSPDAAKAYGHLGDLYQAHEYPDQALACYRRAIAVGDNYEWHYQMFWVHSKEGRPKEALQSLREALALNPGYAPAYYHLGEHLREEAKLDLAENAYRKYVELRPDDASGYVGLALVAKMRGDDDEAMREFLLALKRNPSDYRVHFQLAQIYRRRGDVARADAHQGAYQSLPRRIKISDPLASRIRWLGSTPLNVTAVVHDLHLQKRNDEALEFALEAVRRRPRNALVLQALAASYRRVGNLEGALEAAKKSLAVDPNHISSWCTLCEVYLGEGRWNDVIEAADKAIEVDPTRDYAYWLKGQALRRSDRLSEAIECYKLAAQRAPGNFIVCASLAGALHQAGRLTEAQAAYRQALRAKPGDQRVVRRLQDVERQLQRQAASQPAASQPVATSSPAG